MKKLLLTSAIVAVSGAAFAEITWSGDADLYWNTHRIEADNQAAITVLNTDGTVSHVIPSDDYRYEEDTATGNQHGLRFEASITPTATAELDSGIKATLKYDLDISYANDGAKANDNAAGNAITVEEGFPTLILESSAGTFTVGEVDHAAHGLFKDVSMAAVEFEEEDDELNARVDTKFQGVTVGVNYVVAEGSDDYYVDSNGVGLADGMSTGSYTAGAAGTFGQFTVTAGYELDSGLHYDANGNQIDADPSTVAMDAYETATHGESVNWNQNGIDVTVAYIAMQDDLDNKASSLGLGAKYTLQNGVNLAGYVNGNNAENAAGNQSSWMSYKVQAGFKAMGADITLGYKDEISGWTADGATSTTEDAMNNPENPNGTEGVFMDATYEVAPGATVMAGYDGTDLIQAYKNVDELNDAGADSLYGSYYVGGSYALGGGAKVYLTHSNAIENDPAEDVKAGTTLGLSLAF